MSDDDLPPDLEDMSDHLQKVKLATEKKGKVQLKEEELKHVEVSKNETVIQSSEELIDQDVKPAKKIETKKKEKESFGGMRAGFFNNPPPKKTKP